MKDKPLSLPTAEVIQRHHHPRIQQLGGALHQHTPSPPPIPDDTPPALLDPEAYAIAQAPESPIIIGRAYTIHPTFADITGIS